MDQPEHSYVKAFTQEARNGNPALVIENPDMTFDSRISPRIAALMHSAKCSVAAIIGNHEQENVPLRIFYKHGEIETLACGHATLAAAHILFSRGEHTERTFIDKEGREIKVLRFDDGKISQEQSFPEIKEMKYDREVIVREISKALGIDSNEIQDQLPIQKVGVPKKIQLLIPVSSEALLNITRNYQKIKEICEKYEVTGLFPFTQLNDDIQAHARHFPNRDEEDLVCGVGAIALSRYLQEHKLPNQNEFIIRCGPEKGGVGDVIVRIENIEGKNKVFLEGYAVTESVA